MTSKHNVQRNIIIFITTLLFFYEFGLNNIYNALTPYMSSAFQLNHAKVGFISSLFFYTEIALLIPAGLILDRYSAKRIIIAVLLISATGVLLNAAAHDSLTLSVSRILMGIGGAFSFVGCVRIIANWSTQKNLAIYLGLLTTVGIAGGYAVQTPLVALIEAIGWRHALIVVAILGLVIAILILFIVQDRPQGIESKQRQQTISIKNAFKMAFHNRQNVMCGLYTSLMNLPLFVLGAIWGISYLHHVADMSLVEASNICGMLFIGTMIGSPFFGYLSDRLKNRTRLMKLGALLSLVIMIVGIMAQPTNVYTLLGSFFVLGFITSTQMISYPTVVESNSKTISGAATSVISMLAMLGGAIMQPAFGLIITEFSASHGVKMSYQYAIWLLPLAFFIALIASFFITETNCSSID